MIEHRLKFICHWFYTIFYLNKMNKQRNLMIFISWITKHNNIPLVLFSVTLKTSRFDSIYKLFSISSSSQKRKGCKCNISHVQILRVSYHTTEKLKPKLYNNMQWSQENIYTPIFIILATDSNIHKRKILYCKKN